jgi:hypothetical protein
MAQSTLRVVGPGETPRRIRYTVDEAAEQGDELDLQYAMRRRLAKAIADEDCPKRDLAALSRRLEDVVAKIKLLEAAVAEEEVDRASAADDSFDASAI